MCHVLTLHLIVTYTFSSFKHFLYALTHSSKTVRSTILGVDDLEGTPEPPDHSTLAMSTFWLFMMRARHGCTLSRLNVCVAFPLFAVTGSVREYMPFVHVQNGATGTVI